ncbi:hypothetical protein FRC00_004398 [Tulasnella sp. 408]|nr:hypothetical protein FRC00_004398 [Tulasnella sp. 408]
MDPRAFDPYNPPIFEVPVPPQDFGKDGGKFYHYYDSLAEEIDDDMVTGLKEQLDGLLIFAGLFAGVNTAFLALTLPLMSPDPADDTNALLRDNNLILLNLALGRNDTLPGTNPLPSETFSPTGKILTVNVLFSISLTCAIVSSFVAVLGRQWLVYYRKRRGGGPEARRWEQLKRFLGAARWRLELVLDDVLPSLLQIGLIIFCISLTIYLNILHPVLAKVVGALMGAGLASLVLTAIFATWDKFCPFQSPLSHALSPTLSLLIYLAVLIAVLVAAAVAPAALLMLCVRNLRIVYDVDRRHSAPPGMFETFYRILVGEVYASIDEFMRSSVKRKEEGDGLLQITAIKRAICTSDDARTQTHAVSNILAITDRHLLDQLVTDKDFGDRISDLGRSSYHRTLQLCGRDRLNLAAEACWLYRAAVTHVRLLSANPRDGRWFGDEVLYWSTSDASMSLLSLDMIQRAPPNMLTAWLGYLADSENGYPSQARHLALGFIIDELVNSSWRSVSMATVAITVMWGNKTDHGVLHAAYSG